MAKKDSLPTPVTREGKRLDKEVGFFGSLRPHEYCRDNENRADHDLGLSRRKHID